MGFRIGLLLYFLIGITSISGRRVTVKDCGKSKDIEPRIVGGEPVTEGFLPWMVTMHENYDVDFQHICGGTILNEWWIVTAAHCMENPDKPHVYEIYVGLHRLSRKSAATVSRHGIAKIIKHQNYTGLTDYNNDIALLKVATPIDFTGREGFVNGICLPEKDEREHKSVAMIAGWGHTKQSGDTSDVLRTVTVPMISREECNKIYTAKDGDIQHDINDNMICAGAAGLDSCQADSGGPLIMWKNFRATLYGIVSFGNGCGTHGYPGVYTKVSAYVDWIEKTIKANS